VRPHRGQMREFLQAGIELIGAPAPQGTAEALTVLYHALDAVGLRDFRIGLGDASLYPMLLRSHDVPDVAVDRLMDALVGRDFVALESQLARLGLDDDDAELLLRVPQIRGGPEVLAGAEGPVANAVAGLASVTSGSCPKSRSASSSTSASCARWATTRARCSTSTTRRSARRSAAAAATTTCSGASGARCRRSASR